MQGIGAGQGARAQAGATNAEIGRQRGFQDASFSALDRTVRGTDRATVDADAAAAAQSRRAAARTAAAPAMAAGYLPGMAGAPQIVRDETDRRRALANMFVDQQIGARATLGGFDDADLRQRIAAGRSAQDIATQAGFARGSASVLPAARMAAGTRGQNLRTAGQLVQTAGMLGGMTYGGPRGWGSLFGGGGATPNTVGGPTAPGIQFP